MSWWSGFLKLRRQNDIIKIVCLYVAIGVFFLADAVSNGISFYRDGRSYVEYIMIENAQKAVTETRLNEIRELDGVMEASRQRMTVVSMKFGTNETELPCVELSEAYMAQAYGIRSSGAMKTFYVNRQAYEQIRGSDEGQKGREDTDGLRISYTEEGTHTVQEANVALLSEDATEEGTFVCSRGSGARLSESTDGIRVMVGGQEAERSAGQIRSLGFEIQNEQGIREAQYRQKLWTAEIRYALATAAVSLSAAGILLRIFHKNEYRK